MSALRRESKCPAILLHILGAHICACHSSYPLQAWAAISRCSPRPRSLLLQPISRSVGISRHGSQYFANRFADPDVGINNCVKKHTISVKKHTFLQIHLQHIDSGGWICKLVSKLLLPLPGFSGRSPGRLGQGTASARQATDCQIPSLPKGSSRACPNPTAGAWNIPAWFPLYQIEIGSRLV